MQAPPAGRPDPLPPATDTSHEAATRQSLINRWRQELDTPLELALASYTFQAGALLCAAVTPTFLAYHDIPASRLQSDQPPPPQLAFLQGEHCGIALHADTKEMIHNSQLALAYTLDQLIKGLAESSCEVWHVSFLGRLKKSLHKSGAIRGPQGQLLEVVVCFAPLVERQAPPFAPTQRSHSNTSQS